MSLGSTRTGGGPAPSGNGSKPVHFCPPCGAMYTGGTHTCRETKRPAAPAAEREDEREPEAGG
jgi:hypothetical protein